MEWYLGSGFDDLAVPKDQELPDRLPSPESWSKWGISASESFRSPYKCFDMDENSTQQEVNFNGEKDQSCGSSMCEGLSEECFNWRTHSRDQPDCQLNDFAGFEQMNDIFLSSLLEDLPETENLDESFYFSPESDYGMMAIDNLDSQSISSDAENVMGSSKYLKRHAFSPPMGWDNGDVTAVQFIPCNTDQLDCPREKELYGKDMVSSEQNEMDGTLGQDTSLEESVLHELELVMEQLPEKTRICFRDALYRLAKNSKPHMETLSNDGYLVMEKSPPLTTQDVTMRSESKKAVESETNTIDRAIANLMFNKTDASVREVREFSSAASVSSNEGVSGDTQPPVNSKQEVMRATGPQNYSSNQPKIHHFPDQQILAGDAEVPTLFQIDPRETNHKKNTEKVNENYRNPAEKRKSFVLDFGSAI
ncbi:hypothetical protein ACB094_11G146000 [Castanea mollissima]